MIQPVLVCFLCCINNNIIFTCIVWEKYHIFYNIVINAGSGVTGSALLKGFMDYDSFIPQKKAYLITTAGKKSIERMLKKWDMYHHKNVFISVYIKSIATIKIAIKPTHAIHLYSLIHLDIKFAAVAIKTIDSTNPNINKT